MTKKSDVCDSVVPEKHMAPPTGFHAFMHSSMQPFFWLFAENL
jgi:hypothetical protein